MTASSRTGAGLFIAMAAAIAVVAALAWWDSERESAAAFAEFEAEQSILAITAARDPATIASDLRRIERDSELRVLLLEPGRTEFVTTDGRTVSSAMVRDALLRGERTVVLDRPDAAAIGLAARRAVVGLATIDTKDGRYGVAIAASARRERDRERRARLRLLLSVSLASTIVFVFGAIARRNQRKELELERELAIAEVSRRGDERLGRANRIAMMGTLATGVAHEISTPLGVIAGRAEQLIARTDDERSKKGLSTILEQTDRIALVVRGFLDLARGKEPALSRRDPAEVARGAVRLVEHRFEQAGVSLATDIADALPPVQCDARLMEHAVVNLLLNGCQASPRGETVKLTVMLRDERVAFDVVDRGPGITEDHASQALEPFFTTKPEGSGLGLAITSEIVKAHRGTLTLAPSPPHGTRATIEIPLAPQT